MARYIFLFFSCISFSCIGQRDSLQIIKPRVRILAVAAGVAYTAGIVGMNELWYKNQPRSSFHFFNDLPEWYQVDKAGHFQTAFVESYVSMKALEWAGLSKPSAVLIGSIAGFAFQLPVEFLDGYASEYGASLTDLAANFGGSAFLWTQYKVWDEVKIMPKFSYRPTQYAQLRPNILGKTFLQKVFKDYNGQTYWLSFPLASWNKLRTVLPLWLNFAIGYGGEGMVFATTKYNSIDRYRQLYFAIDIDFSKIKTKSRLLKTILESVNMLHIPAPAIEINKHKIRFHPLYF